EQALKDEKEQAARKTGARYEATWPIGSTGTVGAVALDREGNLAAATSTGGLTNKRPGRVGDSPLIGAGTYANNSSCAVSAMGNISSARSSRTTSARSSRTSICH